VTYHLLGVPFRTGSLYPGNEGDAQAYRAVQILSRLQAAGCNAVDDGDIPIPSYLPHHSIPPIRSWPGPRIVWDFVSERIAPLLEQPGHIPLLLGCDCSVVVGTAQALRHARGEDIHVVYIDGDFDDAPPNPSRCQSAAALAVWLLTNPSPFWTASPLRPSQVTVVGWTNPSESGRQGVSLADVRKTGARAAAIQVLESIPAEAPILIHFDVDVIRQKDMPAAYFPHAEGMTLAEIGDLLDPLLKDPRVRLIEVSEYATLRDAGHRCVTELAGLLAKALGH
jgi:arginase